MTKFDTLIKNNNIDLVMVHDAIYEQILLNILFRVCNYLEDRDNLKNFKAVLRTKTTKFAERLAYRELVGKHTKLKLLDDEIDYFIKHIILFFDKSRTRNNEIVKLRKQLLEKQNYKCKYCGQALEDNNKAHVDHIVPFKVVGDELSDNYQCLCSSCNHSKGARLNYLINILCDMRL